MKNYHKYFQYFYLLITALFLYDAYGKYQKNEVYWTSLLLAALGVFMFFFKRKFAKKFEDRNNQ